MRKRIYFGNWKMKLGYAESVKLAHDYVNSGLCDLIKSKNEQRETHVFAAVPFLPAKEIAEIFKGHDVKPAAQSCSVMAEAGAYTGEVSAAQLAEIGIQGTLVGHSERRTIAMETDAMLNQKVTNALSAKLITCLCIGETADERAAGNAFAVIDSQLEKGLVGMESNPNTADYLVIGYEPVWAISSTAGAREATMEEVAEVMVHIRAWVKQKFGAEVGGNMPLLYGGSVKPENAPQLLAIEDIDGFIPGNASLDAEKLKAIIAA
jgi:triosephosphate isomerase